LETGGQRKEQILNAAVGVFGKFGFKKTSVDDLAAAAGISKQGLYLHFSSKEEVFLAGLQKYLDDCLSRVQRELTKPGSSLLARN
jgi:AcrR family transcriptional regulator